MDSNLAQPGSQNGFMKLSHKRNKVKGLRTLIDYDCQHSHGEKFSIVNWCDLQENYKTNLSLIKMEIENKSKLTESIYGSILEYQQLYLDFKESMDKIKKKLMKQEFNVEKMRQVLLLDEADHQLSHSQLYIKKLLHLLRKHPQIITTLVLGDDYTEELQSFEETLMSTFFEDITSNKLVNGDYLKFLHEILVQTTAKANQIEDLDQKGFASRMISVLQRNEEFKSYVNNLLKASMKDLLENDFKFICEVKQNITLNTRNLQDLEYFVKDSIDLIPARNSKSNISLSSILKVTASPVGEIQNKEAQLLVQKSLEGMAIVANQVIQYLFDHVGCIPLIQRIIAKISFKEVQKKFPQAKKEDQLRVVFNVVLKKWILPSIMYTEAIDSADKSNNIEEVTKLLTKIFERKLYTYSEYRSYLNPLIEALQDDIIKYYEDLIRVDDKVIQAIIDEESEEDEIQTISISISLQAIKSLTEQLLKNEAKVKEVSKEAVTLAEKIDFYAKKKDSFGPKIDPNTKKPLLIQNAFIVFNDVVFQKNQIENYMEYFEQNSSPRKEDASLDEMAVFSTKIALKSFLIRARDMSEILRNHQDRTLSLLEILEKLSNPTQIDAFGNSQLDEIQIEANFVHSLLARLPQSYKENEFEKLYLEIIEESRAVTKALDQHVASTKLQLISKNEIARKKCEQLKSIINRKKQTLDRTTAREIIRALRIQFCLYFPSSQKGSRQSLQEQTVYIVFKDQDGLIQEEGKLTKEQAQSLGLNSSNGETIDDFARVFGSLQEIDSFIKNGKDDNKLLNVVSNYSTQILERIKVKDQLKDKDVFETTASEIGNFLTKRISAKIDIRVPTKRDDIFWKQCKLHSWVQQHHLGISLPLVDMNCEMWERAIKMFSSIAERSTPQQKLQALSEAMKTIQTILKLAQQQLNSNSDNMIISILILLVIQSCPKTMHSNIAFIELMRDFAIKKHSHEEYYLMETKSVITIIENFEADTFKMNPSEYKKLVDEKKRELGSNIVK